jgi:hypothetical protein
MELIIKLERQYPVLNNSVTRRRGYGQAVGGGICFLRPTMYSDGQIGPNQVNEVWGRRSKDFSADGPTSCGTALPRTIGGPGKTIES